MMSCLLELDALCDTPSNIHEFIFNDDGFEVCSKCGICTSSRLMESSISEHEYPIPNYWSQFSEILINNHIGYIDRIEDEYKKIKIKLLRGYPNISLYAYQLVFRALPAFATVMDVFTNAFQVGLSS